MGAFICRWARPARLGRYVKAATFASLSVNIPETESQSISELPQIEGYEILALAGRGGMSVVYKARQLALNRVVAIKMPHRRLILDATAMQRLMQEGRLAVSLHHANIATTFACSITKEGDPFLVMEFLPGQSLDELVQSQAVLDLETFRELFLQVLSGLAHAHNAGIIHRDLKPGNILMVSGESGKLLPKIVDFGIAKLLEQKGEEQRLTRSGAIVGSPAYMSPEQWMSQPVDRRSDIYSLGCVMYKVLTAHLPYESENAFESMTQHLNADVTPPSIVSNRAFPSGLDALILKMMSKVPDDRYATCQAVLNDLCSLNFAHLIPPAHDLNKESTNKLATRQLKQKALSWFTLAVVGVIAAFCYLSTIPGHDAGTLKQAQEMFDKGQYLKSAMLISGDSKIKIENLSTRKQVQLFELEFILAQALADDDNNKSTTMRAVLREQALQVPAAAIYGQVLDVILVPAYSLTNVRMTVPESIMAPDQYLVSLVKWCQGLRAKFRHENRDAETFFVHALTAAKQSDKPVQELEILNALIAFYPSSIGGEAKKTQAIKDGYQVAWLLPKAGYESARALVELVDLTKSVEPIMSSKLALSIDDSTTLPKVIRAKIALAKGRAFEGRDDYPNAILQFDKIFQQGSCLEPNLLGEAHILKGQCKLKQRQVSMGVSELQTAIDIFQRIEGADNRAQWDRTILIQEIKALAVLDKEAARQLTERLNARYKRECIFFADSVAKSAHILENPSVLQQFADELDRGLFVLQASDSYADALPVAQTRLKIMKALNELKKDQKSAEAELHASEMLTRIQKKLSSVEHVIVGK